MEEFDCKVRRKNEEGNGGRRERGYKAMRQRVLVVGEEVVSGFGGGGALFQFSIFLQVIESVGDDAVFEDRRAINDR